MTASLRRPFLVLSLLLGLASGCAHQTYSNKIQPYGDSSAIGEFAKLSARSNEMDVEEAAHIKVLVNQLPEGMTTKDGELSYDRDRYSVVAEVKVTDDPSYIGLWFEKYDDHEKWKSGYCNAQVPLNWITLYTWPILPFYWPCWKGGLKEEDRLEHMVARIRTAAVVLGANLIVAVPGSTSLVERSTRRVVSTADMTHLMGLIIKDNGPGAAPKKSPSTAIREVTEAHPPSRGVSD